MGGREIWKRGGGAREAQRKRKGERGGEKRQLWVGDRTPQHLKQKPVLGIKMTFWGFASVNLKGNKVKRAKCICTWNLNRTVFLAVCHSQRKDEKPPTSPFRKRGSLDYPE